MQIRKRPLVKKIAVLVIRVMILRGDHYIRIDVFTREQIVTTKDIEESFWT